MRNVFRIGVNDFLEGWRARRLWMAFAKESIDDNHRNTLLGPIWLLLNYLMFVGTFRFIMRIGANDESYTLHISIGLLVWFFMHEAITQGVSLFSREEGFIKGTPLPLSTYVFRMAMQSGIRSGYSLLGCMGILLLSGAYPSVFWLWSVLGFAIIIATAPAVITILAFVGAYFPDSRYLVSNAMRIGMFLTPVFWTYSGSHGARHFFYWYNPFTYFLEVVRIPIINGTLPLNALFLCVFVGVIMWGAAIFLMGRYRKKVVFVL